MESYESSKVNGGDRALWNIWNHEKIHKTEFYQQLSAERNVNSSIPKLFQYFQDSIFNKTLTK